MQIADEILERWAGKGYPQVTINLWHGVNLYVNIKGEQPFYYEMDSNCMIHSRKSLKPQLFAQARTLLPFLRAHKDEVRQQMAGGQYYTA